MKISTNFKEGDLVRTGVGNVFFGKVINEWDAIVYIRKAASNPNTVVVAEWSNPTGDNLGVIAIKEEDVEKRSLFLEALEGLMELI